MMANIFNLIEKVCLVTVTYGNRGYLLEQVIEAVKYQSGLVNRIIVVDNGSTNILTFGHFNTNRIDI